MTGQPAGGWLPVGLTKRPIHCAEACWVCAVQLTTVAVAVELWPGNTAGGWKLRPPNWIVAGVGHRGATAGACDVAGACDAAAAPTLETTVAHVSAMLAANADLRIR